MLWISTQKAGLRGWRVWVNLHSKCFMAVWGHSLNFHVGICTSCSLYNKDQLCFLIVLFTPKRLFVQHSLYFQNIWNCTNASLLFKAHSKSLVLSHWFCYIKANTNQDILGRSFWMQDSKFKVWKGFVNTVEMNSLFIYHFHWLGKQCVHVSLNVA